MLTQPKLQSLEKLLRQNQLTISPVELVTYEIDAGVDRGTPDALALPENAGDVARLVKWASENNVPLIARGAGTGLSGGAVANRGGVIVEFARMNRILELDVQSRVAVVEPGVVNLALDQRVKQIGLYYPPDPASQRSATMGGNAAENSGGPHCFKYGVTTNYVLGMQITLADGRALQLGGRALDVPAYDFTGVLVGSEGTLALMTAIITRLVRNPPGVKTMMASFNSIEQAGDAVSAVITAGLMPATLEMMDRAMMRIVEDYAHAGLPVDAHAALIVEVDGFPASLDAQMEEVADILHAHGARSIRIAQTAGERERIWHARRSVAGAITKLAPSYYLVDITVPRSKLAEALARCEKICARYNLQTGHVFHAGDGNLHPLILIPNPHDRELMARVLKAGREMVQVGIEMDGSITGEHGVGIEKRAYMPLMYSAAELSAMRDLKEIFDPRELLNPGKVLPAELPKVELPRADAPAPESHFAPASADEAARAFAALSAARRSVWIGNLPSAIRNPRPVSLSTSALTGIRAYAPDDLYITVGAGTQLAEIQEFLARDKKFLPLASPYADATIGGMVAANFNAPLRMRYGAIRDLVLCMTVVLGDGRVIRAGRPVVKNVAGYDLPKLFIGAHGTLGLITDMSLKISVLPRARRTLIARVDDLARGLEWAGALAQNSLVASGVVLGHFRNPKSEIRNSGFALAYTAEGIAEDVRAEIEQARAILRAAGAPEPRELDAPSATDLWREFLATEPDALQIRVGLASKDLPAFVNAHTLTLSNFFADAANGLIYAAASPANADAARAWIDTLRAPAVALGGYAIAIHAPENLRGAFDAWGDPPESIELMRALKSRYDPAGILNPGVFVV
ncbi:MAG: FAD-binding protein [Chloroflexi bacterium]|nr:FAD-binding protein [Chloroflexota bacterium]